MPLEIVRNDITKVVADAIVNTANPEVAYGEGVDSAIYAAAGADKLLRERAKIGKMIPGTAAATPAFNLAAKYIIHTIGPVWQDGEHGESAIVASCYRNSLALAKEKGCESIAFPLIATGTYGFPKDLALKIAITEISTFLFENDMTVYMVVYDKEAFVLSGKLFNDVTEYIKETDVVHRSLRKYEITPAAFKRRTIEGGFAANAIPESVEHELLYDTSTIDDRLKKKGETFQEHLFRIIDKRDLKDSEVYKKANIDRKHFSKIRNNVNYSPTKRTAVALAIALELNLDETLDLLGKAGLTLSGSSAFDIIIEYCIENHITNVLDINCILFEHEQPLLGA